MMTKHLTVDEVLILHEYAIQRYGGSHGIASVERLESAFDPNHPFVDGNKRTALYAMLRFLETNGFVVTVTSNDDLYQFAIDIATSTLDKEQIEEWLKAHTVPAP